MSSLLLDIAIKGTLALLATVAAAAALRGASAATRHAVWTMGMVSALALPVLARLLPGWSVPVLPAAPVVAASTVASAASAGPGMDRLLALAWAAGVAIVILSIVLGRIRIAWIARGSQPLDHGEIPALVTALCGRMGISRRVSVRLCPDRVMPMVWGVARPVILLPAAATGWAPELRRDVLLHELAHVRRHDYLNQLVTRLACAVHWFNPLAWMAARRLRAERERACDDQVLRTGASPCDYAEHLIAVARGLRPVGRGTMGIAMAGRSAFGERVAALLDARCARGILTSGLLLRSGIGAACVVVPLAALHPGARTVVEAPPPGPIVGPPPSANARAAGALREVERKRTTPDSDAATTPRPAIRGSANGDRAPHTARRTVTLYHVPEIRAVIHLTAAPLVVPSEGAAESTECEKSTAPAEGPVAPAPSPDLVWIPVAGTTP
jgi:beta-lactamase regulating signal transducer with metallopeptidase domain